MWYAILLRYLIFLTIYGIEVLDYGFNWAVLVSTLVNIPGLVIYNFQISNLQKVKS